MICGRCGWFMPADCTCRRDTDRLAALRLKDAMEKRHREAVARALQSARTVEGWVAGRWRTAG